VFEKNQNKYFMAMADGGAEEKQERGREETNERTPVSSLLFN